MVPRPARSAAYVAAGLLGAATGAYALARGYGAHLRQVAVAEDLDLELPDGIVTSWLTAPDGARLHVVELGGGSPVVLLHGAGLSSQVWAYQLRDLAGARRVVVPDLRGHGRSVAGIDGVTISAMAEDVGAVIDVLGLEGAIVVGHSMGGMVALRLARHHHELLGGPIAAIALLSTSGGLGPKVPAGDHFGRLVGSVVGSGLGHLRRGRPVFPAGDLGYVASRLSFGTRARPEHVAATLALLQGTDPDVLTRLAGEVLGFEERGGFGDLELPVAIAVGTKDWLTPPRHARRLAASVPRATLHEYVGAGHMLMYERREEIADLVAELERRVARS